MTFARNMLMPGSIADELKGLVLGRTPSIARLTAGAGSAIRPASGERSLTRVERMPATAPAARTTAAKPQRDSET